MKNNIALALACSTQLACVDCIDLKNTNTSEIMDPIEQYVGVDPESLNDGLCEVIERLRSALPLDVLAGSGNPIITAKDMPGVDAITFRNILAQPDLTYRTGDTENRIIKECNNGICTYTMSLIWPDAEYYSDWTLSVACNPNQEAQVTLHVVYEKILNNKDNDNDCFILESKVYPMSVPDIQCQF